MLKKCNVEKYARTYAGFLELAMHTAQNAATAWQTMINENIDPDLICSCASNGTAFGLGQYFPKAAKIGYADPGLLGCSDNALRDARQLVQELQFRESDLNFAFCREQLPSSLLPPARIPRILPLFTDTAYFAPAGKGRDLLIFCGYKPHINLNAAFNFLQAWLKRNPASRGRILAENALAGTARPEFLTHFAPELRQQIEILKNPEKDYWQEALAQSGLMLCLGGDAWTNRRLLDAMSAGVPIASANATELLQPGNTCLQLPQKTGVWLDFVDAVINQPESVMAISRGAREYVEENHCQARILSGHMAEIMRLVEAKGTINPALAWD